MMFAKGLVDSAFAMPNSLFRPVVGAFHLLRERCDFAHLCDAVDNDREMVEILALVLLHDEQMVLAAVELAFDAGAPNKQTVLNILSRLLDSPPVPPLQTPQAFAPTVEPQANVGRYDRLRDREDNHAA